METGLKIGVMNRELSQYKNIKTKPMKKKKHAGGREPLDDFDKKFRIVTFISKADIANDRGHKAFDRQVDKHLDSLKPKIAEKI